MAPQPLTLQLSHFADEDRVEAARLALFLASVPFVDERLSHDELAARKAQLPFERLPVLRVNGELFAETDAILRFAGRLGELYPVAAPFAALRVDELLSGLEEFSERIAPCLDEDTPAELRRDLAKREIPRCFSQLDARLQDMQGLPFFRDKSADVLVHELAIFAWVQRLRSGSVAQFTTELFAKFRRVDEVVAKVLAHPRVKHWYLMTHTAAVSEPVERIGSTAAHYSPAVNMHKTAAIPKLKLTYFFSTGRAEAIRLALAIGGVPFEDEHISAGEFALLKPTLPFHKLPVLRVDGQGPVAQAHAILRYVGSLCGLYPAADAVEALRVDELLAVIDEGMHDPLWTESFDEAPEKKLAMRTLSSRETIPAMLARLDRRLSSCHGPYATGKALTVADLAITALVEFLESGALEGVPNDVAKPYKHVRRIVDAVDGHSKVQEWRKAHPLRPQP